MKANHILRNGHLVSSLLGIALLSTTLVGCGTDLSTNPGIALQGQSEDIGTLPIPVRRNGVPIPQALTGEILTGNTVLLRWQPLAGGYSAVITLDGRELTSSASASEGQFTDSSVTSSGTHVYDVCFTKGKKCGTKSHVILEFSDRPGGDVGRPGTGEGVRDGSN